LRESGARGVRLSKYVAAMMTSVGAAPPARFKSVLGQFALADRWAECRA
jgi:hypothetical protein